MMRFILLLFFCITGVANVNGSTPAEVPDTMAERVKACTICHSAEDKVGRDAYYPRIAGKPQGYLFNQMRNFRDGRRYYPPMAILLENMSDEYLLEIAQYFSSLQLPYPDPERIQMQPEEIKLAEHLIYSGYPERDIPACSACHGDVLMGVEPAIPGLIGLPRAYITAQLGGWRNGGIMRGGKPDCMSAIAKQLTEDEVNAVAKWLANQSASGKPSSFDVLSSELIDRCSRTILENGGAE
ncbi:c-type cytochrome [uncultured Nitrosomonas sp.]|uniref:c-type cytochrome n=1 Tax=uncultured Nitrosomonas sp. TaxID=156424 RepID=UPI0025CEA98D|nr:c-type cytochrome [uncultured Nitrosomonas sp.]